MTESLMDLAGCLKSTTRVRRLSHLLKLASSASVLSSLASYVHELSRILAEKNRK